MGKQGEETRLWSSSTVLLDPAALIESCKQQIQGKDGIPAEHQRLIFACRVANQKNLSYTCKRSSRCPGTEENAVSEFLKELRGWEAILKDDKHNIAKLLHPWVRAEEQVVAEDERKALQLSCQTARELRSMGIPCNVYYLFFDKWIPVSLKNGKCCKEMSNVEIQIDKEFQARSFQISLFGRLNGSSLSEPFVYRMNGGEVAAKVSMLEQMAQYRQGQKTRHRLGLSTQSVGKGVEGRDVQTAVVENDGLLRDGNNVHDKSEREDDYYCPCGKGLDFTVIISNDHQLKCFVLKVIQVPADAGRKQEQLASHVPGRCDRGNPNAQHDSNMYCVSSSSGAPSLRCENPVSESKAAFAESAECCQFAKTSSQPRKGSELTGASCPCLCPCPLEVPGSDNSQSSTSSDDVCACPGNESLSSPENAPEGLLTRDKQKKKKKKKRNGKRDCSLTTDNPGTSTPDVPTINESSASCSERAMVERHSGCCETRCCSGSIGDRTDGRIPECPLMEGIVRELSTCGVKNEGGQVSIFRREIHCTENGTEDRGSSSMMRTEAMKIGQGYLAAEIAEILSDQKALALSKQSPKDISGANAGLRRGDDFLHVERGTPWSAACLGTGSGSCELSAEFRDSHAAIVCGNADHGYMCTSRRHPNNLSQPFVGPIMVEMGLQKSSGLPSRSSGDSRAGPQYPSRELDGSIETFNDTNSLLDSTDAHFSARGGYNGSSGTGSRNGRSGADGSGNRSHGRGSEDRKGNTSGYHGGGQGSSGSNHGSGPGGSSTSGSSGGGSGGGNGNRGGGKGSNGGSWDGRRSDDDGGNGSKEGDNDERYRNSFQTGSNGETVAAADLVARKKGISSLDNRGCKNNNNLSRKGNGGGGVIGDQLANGTSSSHGSLVTLGSGGKENISNSRQKVQQKPLAADDADEVSTQDSVPPSQSTTGSEEGTPRAHTDQKFAPPFNYVNGFVQHDLPPTKESNLTENRDGVDHYPHMRAAATAAPPAPTQDSFVKVLKQSITDNAHNTDDDRDHLPSSTSWVSKDSWNPGTTVPGLQQPQQQQQQESLKGAWQKKISWDDQRQPSLSNNSNNSKPVQPEASSQVGPAASKGKLSVKPTRNGVQVKGSQPSSDNEIVTRTKSSSAPSTPSYSQDNNLAESRGVNQNYPKGPTDVHVEQGGGALLPFTTTASEQAPQARMQAANSVPIRQPIEARSAPEEASQRQTTTWKSRKPTNDQERPLVNKPVGDRDRTTTYWAQKWVPVEHKSGASGKGSGTQSNSSGNVRSVVLADGSATEGNESHQDSVNNKEVVSSGEDRRREDLPPTPPSDIPPTITSPSKSLRRLQTFPSDDVNTLLRVSGSHADAAERREFVAPLASERPSGHPEQANLRGLLPRERTVDNLSTTVVATAQSTPLVAAGGHSIPVQSSLPGEQKQKLRLDDRSSKSNSGGAVLVKSVLSPAEEESRRVARAILDAVDSSCRDRRAAEVAVREVGYPMAEFEKVLGAVAPSFFAAALDSSLPSSRLLNEVESPCVSGRGGAIRSSGRATCEEEVGFSVCRCSVLHVPLNSIWQWYEEPSYYGVEVRAVSSQKLQKNGEEEEEPFLAYFVPYLSGLQIFGHSSSDADSRSLGRLGSTTRGNVEAPLSSQPKAFSGSDMLATLFPTPGKADESSSHVRPGCTVSGQKESAFREDNCGIQLLYEFYDADLPQVRQPLFTKVKELVEGISSFNSYSRGDATVLDGLCLGDVHPASWFAVAWYPIYRIPEGPLRAVFLTYHSFNHFAPRSSLSCLMGGAAADVDSNISIPVVGLECYNLQSEPWLSMGELFSEEATKARERLSVNPSQCLENRINSLQEVAAGMAKGIPDSKSAVSADGSNSANKFRHSDYEFFVKRRR